MDRKVNANAQTLFQRSKLLGNSFLSSWSVWAGCESLRSAHLSHAGATHPLIPLVSPLRAAAKACRRRRILTSNVSFRKFRLA